MNNVEPTKPEDLWIESGSLDPNPPPAVPPAVPPTYEDETMTQPEGEELNIRKGERFSEILGSNDKVQLDNLISHEKAMFAQSEAMATQLQQVIEIANSAARHATENANMAEKQLIEHNDERFRHYMENNRYTLDRTYPKEVEEAAALETVLNTLTTQLAEIQMGVVAILKERETHPTAK